MCNQITKKGTKCRLQPNKELCFKHKTKYIIQSLQTELAETQHELTMTTERLSYLEHQLHSHLKLTRFKFIQHEIEKHLTSTFKEMSKTNNYREANNFLNDKKNKAFLSDLLNVDQTSNMFHEYNRLREERNKIAHEVSL